MNKSVIILFVILIFSLLAYILLNRASQTETFLSQETKQHEKLEIAGKTIKIEVAQTPEQLAKGLGCRVSFPKDQGMLFLFGRKDFYSFWMKNMRFSLDFIWIDQNVIVDITQNVSENDQEKIYQPKFPIDKVLEVNAGFVKENHVKIGDRINFVSY